MLGFRIFNMFLFLILKVIIQIRRLVFFRDKVFQCSLFGMLFRDLCITEILWIRRDSRCKGIWLLSVKIFVILVVKLQKFRVSERRFINRFSSIVVIRVLLLGILLFSKFRCFMVLVIEFERDDSDVGVIIFSINLQDSYFSCLLLFSIFLNSC